MSPALTSDGIRRALGLAPDGAARRYTSFQVDSRKVETGGLFFALAGEHHHGFEFLDDAAERGALGAVVPEDRPRPALDLEWFPVASPRKALLRLAATVRREADATVVGITGSSGKTTVKEMTASAVAVGRKVHRTRGNRNSTVGLPLSVLEAPEEAEVWVLELGTNQVGEIDRLTRVAAPDHAVVTTVGPAHLEGLDDLEGVLQEKLDLVRGVSARGRVIVGERPPELPAAARAIRPDTVVAGLGEKADLRPDHWSVGGERVEFRLDGTAFRIEAGGTHHLRDALLAVAAARALGVETSEAASGLADYRPLGHRGALRRMGALVVLADCYNANPESFDAAMRWCVEGFPDRPRAAAVGSMLELGDHTRDAHLRVARRLLEAGFDPVAATGRFVEAFEELGPGEARVLTADDPTEAARRLAGELRGDEAVLVKGSRGAKMEQVLGVLEEEFAKEDGATVDDAGANRPAASPGAGSGGRKG